MNPNRLIWLGATLLALPACYASHEVLDGEEYICHCSYEELVLLPSVGCGSDPSCMLGGMAGTIPSTRTVTACSTVRDPGDGVTANIVCTDACTGAAPYASSVHVDSAIDIAENPTCETSYSPILFPVTPPTALRVGHVVPDRSTVMVTIDGVSSPPVQPIATEITVTGNPPPPPGTTPISACSMHEHSSTCSIGFSRGTIELPAFTITDGTSDNNLSVPHLRFEIGPDPSATVPGWNGFWASDGTLGSPAETYAIDDPAVTVGASTAPDHVMGTVRGHGFDDFFSLTMPWSDIHGEVNLRPNLAEIFNHHMTITGIENGTVMIGDTAIPASIALDVFVDFLEGRPLAIMSRSFDPSSHALILDGTATFDHTGAPVRRYVWMISTTGTLAGAYEIATGAIAVVPDHYWRAVLATHPGLLCLLAQDDALFYDLTCVGPPDASTPASPPGIVPPVSGILASMPYESSFFKMIGIAGLEQTLDKPGPQTIFAPSNDALATLPADKLARLLDAQHAAETRAFVLGHVFSPTIPEKSVAQQLGKLKPESGQPIALSPAQVAAAILHADLYATGGVIHLVRTPLVK